jgi:hypothetical protein
MNNVGTWLGPSVAARRARCQTNTASIARIANHLHRNARITDKCAAIAAFGTPFLANHVRTQAALSARSRGPAVGSRHSWWYCDQCACSLSGILSARAKVAGGARQHRQRGDMLWIAVGEQPGEAATPIMANQMKRRSPCPVARRCVARRRSAGRRGSCPSRWIGPGVDRITALVPRHREIARFSSPGAWLCQKSRDTQNPCNIKTQRRSWQRRRPKHRKPSQEPSQFRALR